MSIANSTVLANVSQNLDVTTETYTESVTDNGTQEVPAVQTVTYWMTTAANIIYSYFPMIFLLFGTLGNCLSFTVMLRKEMRSTSVGVYCAALAVADSLAMYSLLFDLIVRGFTGSTVRIDRWLGGRIHLFTTYVGAHMASWLIVSISVDRFIIIWFPLNASLYSSARNAKMVVGFIAALFGTFDGIHMLLFLKGEYNIRNGTSELTEGLTPELSDYLNTSWYLIDGFLYYFIPAPAVAVLNMLIIYKLVKSYRERKGILSSEENSINADNALEKLNVMFVVVSTVFVLSPMPYYIHAVYKMFVTSSDLYASSLVYFLRQFFIALFCVNHSINFYLYCLTGKKFRKELKKLFRSCVCCLYRRERNLMKSSESNLTKPCSVSLSVVSKRNESETSVNQS